MKKPWSKGVRKMTKLVLETKDDWTKKKIEEAVHTETDLLKKAVQKIQSKLQNFENKYGKFNRDSLYGKVDDMELVEWEGELEALKKLQTKVRSLEKHHYSHQNLLRVVSSLKL